MSAPGAFLAALQLADSSLPIGRFVHSGGLETLLDADSTLAEGELVELVESVVLSSAGPLDGVALAEAYRAAARADFPGLVAMDRLVTAHKLAPAARIASTACGRRLAALAPMLVDERMVKAIAAAVRTGEMDGNLAVVEGALAAALAVGVEEAVLVELRATAAGLLSAAVRLGRLTATRAQVALRHLDPALAEAAAEALALDAASIRSTAVELECYALRHRRTEARLFRT